MGNEKISESPSNSATVTAEPSSASGSPKASVKKVHPEMTAKKKSRFVMPAVLSMILLVAGVGAYRWWQHASSVEETDDATIVGRVHQLSSRVSGTVTKILVDDNDHVKAGQLLVQIDPKDFEIGVNAAKAAAAEAAFKSGEIESSIVAHQREAEARDYEAQSALASAKAGVDKAREMLNETKLGVSLAKTEIRQREAELTRAKSDFERYESLVKDRAATMQSFDKAKQDKEVAEANLQSAHEQFKQAQVRVQQSMQALANAESEVTRAKGASRNAEAADATTETTKRKLAVQEAAVAKAKSDFDNAMTQLSYTKLTAPVTGKAGHRTVEVGQQIERGQALMSVVSDDKWVVANFKETQLGRMRPGQRVDIKIDAFPKAHFQGVIDSISPASGAQFALLPPDNASGNFTKVVQRLPVKIVFDKESIKGYENLIAPGMSVIPEVHVGQ